MVILILRKRKIIGNEFCLCLWDDEASKLKDVKFFKHKEISILDDRVWYRYCSNYQVSPQVLDGLPEDMQFELIRPLNLFIKI